MKAVRRSSINYRSQENFKTGMVADPAMNRRSFLKTSLVAGAAFTVLGVHGAESVKSVRLGVIGTGARGTGLMQTLFLFPGVEFRAVCDLVHDRAINAARLAEPKSGRLPEVYAGSESAWEKLVQRDDLDAVLIAVRAKAVAPQDVYDAAVWSAIVPLTIASVAKGGKQVEFPDFTRGRWKQWSPLGIYGS